MVFEGKLGLRIKKNRRELESTSRCSTITHDCTSRSFEGKLGPMSSVLINCKPGGHKQCAHASCVTYSQKMHGVKFTSSSLLRRTRLKSAVAFGKDEQSSRATRNVSMQVHTSQITKVIRTENGDGTVESLLSSTAGHCRSNGSSSG